MIDRNHALPIARQAELVGISRANVYYLPRAASEADVRLMRRSTSSTWRIPLPAAACCVTC
jgi:putative transposase